MRPDEARSFAIEMVPGKEYRSAQHGCQRLRIKGGDGTEFCAYSHCTGCKIPALFFRYGYADYKAHGSMVACGPVWQLKPWSGERRYVAPEDVRDISKFINMMWW